MTGWQVERLEQAAEADGRDGCAIAFVADGGRNAVLIQGHLDGGVGDPEGPARDLVQALRRDIVEACLPLPAARDAAARSIRAAGFDVDEATITTIEDPAADCTRVDHPAAGGIEVVLRGPAA